jgi:hypothetical protein
VPLSFLVSFAIKECSLVTATPNDTTLGTSVDGGLALLSLPIIEASPGAASAFYSFL